MRPFLRAQPFHRGLKIRDAVFLLQPAHQLRGTIGLGGNAMALSRVQVRRDREITLARQPPGEIADVVVQPPPFLHYDRRRRWLDSRRLGDIRLERARTARVGHFTRDDIFVRHRRSPPSYKMAPAPRRIYSAAATGMKPSVPFLSLIWR